MWLVRVVGCPKWVCVSGGVGTGDGDGTITYGRVSDYYTCPWRMKLINWFGHLKYVIGLRLGRWIVWHGCDAADEVRLE